MPERSCSLLVLNYNARDKLKAYLPSVLKSASSSRYACEVVVVDNVSKDDSAAVATQLGAKVFHASGNNYLFSLNEAARASSSDFIIVLNNDVEVFPDFIDPLLRHFETPDVFGVGSQILNMETRTVEMARAIGRFMHGLLTPLCLVEQYLEPDEVGAQPSLYAPGGAAAYRRSMYLQLKGFDPIYYPIYWEDVDLSYRAWRRNWRTLYEPASKVLHEGTGTMKKLVTTRYIDTIKLKNNIVLTWRNVTNIRIQAALLRSLVWMYRRSTGDMAWRRQAIHLALRHLPQALWRLRIERAEAVLKDTDICLMLDGSGPAKWTHDLVTGPLPQAYLRASTPRIS